MNSKVEGSPVGGMQICGGQATHSHPQLTDGLVFGVSGVGLVVWNNCG